MKRPWTMMSVLVAATMGLTPAWAEDMAHEHPAAASAEAKGPMDARHGGQVQHTGMRGYELVRGEHTADLYLYTHSMDPLAVRTSGAAPASQPADAHSHDAPLHASGTATITRADGSTVQAPLVPHRDGSAGPGQLRIAVPADVGPKAVFRCEVAVMGQATDVVTFTHPRAGQSHQAPAAHGEHGPAAH